MASVPEIPRRGEVWLVAFGAARRGEPGKHRPAVVVSADRMTPNAPHALIVVVPLSSSLPASPLRPAIVGVEGVDRPSNAICRAIRGVARTRLVRLLGTLDPGTLAEVERALALTLGLP